MYRQDTGNLRCDFSHPAWLECTAFCSLHSVEHVGKDLQSERWIRGGLQVQMSIE